MAHDIQKLIESALIDKVKNPRVWMAINDLAGLIGYLSDFDKWNKAESDDFNYDFDFLIGRKIERLGREMAEILGDLLEEYKNKKEE